MVIPSVGSLSAATAAARGSPGAGGLTRAPGPRCSGCPRLVPTVPVAMLRGGSYWRLKALRPKKTPASTRGSDRRKFVSSTRVRNWAALVAIFHAEQRRPSSETSPGRMASRYRALADAGRDRRPWQAPWPANDASAPARRCTAGKEKSGAFDALRPPPGRGKDGTGFLLRPFDETLLNLRIDLVEPLFGAVCLVPVKLDFRLQFCNPIFGRTELMRKLLRHVQPYLLFSSATPAAL
jgi:hypothetical protein